MEETKDAIRACLREDLYHLDWYRIARAFDTTHGTVRLIYKKMMSKAILGTVSTETKIGRPTSITPEMDKGIEHLLGLVLYLYQDEIVNFLYKGYGVHVD